MWHLTSITTRSGSSNDNVSSGPLGLILVSLPSTLQRNVTGCAALRMMAIRCFKIPDFSSCPSLPWKWKKRRGLGGTDYSFCFPAIWAKVNTCHDQYTLRFISPLLNRTRSNINECHDCKCYQSTKGMAPHQTLTQIILVERSVFDFYKNTLVEEYTTENWMKKSDMW